PFDRPAHFEHVRANPIARVVPLAGDLLALRQDRLRLADLEDHVALLDAMHDPTQDLAFLADELRVDPLALSVADPLEDDLLDRLRADASELRRLLRQLQLVVDLRSGIETLGLVERDLELRVGDLGDDLLTRVSADGPRLAVDLDAAVLGGG